MAVSSRRIAPGRRRTITAAIGVFVLVVICLQVFLLMVGLDAFITYDSGLAWATALTSFVLATCSVALYGFLRRPGR